MLNGEIIIMGHSTGCQNALLYLAHRKDPKVKGVILQAPVSDI
jgi:predicted alpha/beta hydrolase family esterase